MNEQLMKQLIAELAIQQGRALGVLVVAISSQLDPTRLAEDLRATIRAAKALGELSAIGEKIVTEALAERH